MSLYTLAMPFASGTNPSRNTSVKIVGARETGAALMIPGALEVRAQTPRAEISAGGQIVVPPVDLANEASLNRARAQYQIEGGGALSQRRSRGQRKWWTKLWNAFVGRRGSLRAFPAAV